MIKPISKLQIDMVAQLSWRSVLWLLLTRLVVVADLLVGFFVVDEIGVVGFFVCVCFFFSSSLGGSCSGYFLWLLVVIFGRFFFSLGGFYGGFFLWWLLLVVGLVVFLMGFGGWHGDGMVVAGFLKYILQWW